MSRYSKGNKTHQPTPVMKAEYDSKINPVRVIVVAAMIFIAASAFAYAINLLINKGKGWQQIEADATSELSYADKFSFRYYVTDIVTSKKIKKIYSDTLVETYKNYDILKEYDGLHNLCYINRHPNEEIVVSDLLYGNLADYLKYDEDLLYMGPLYYEYESLLSSEDDVMAAMYDPDKSDEQKAFFDGVLAFVKSGDIKLLLLGDNKIKLQVSESYKKFSDEYEGIPFISFSWMENAFAIDYVADTLIEAGYTKGCISTYDGFSRGLDSSGTVYSIPMFHREGRVISSAGEVEYDKPTSFVVYRNYSLNSWDFLHYYTYSDGTDLVPYIDPDTGRSAFNTDTLCCQSEQMGCAALALCTARYYMTGAESIISRYIDEDVVKVKEY